MAVRIPGCKAVRKTPKALVVQFQDGEEEVIPDSQIDDDSEVYQVGDEGDLIISDWLAKKIGVE